MGIFRRARDTKSLAGRRTSAAVAVQDARVLAPVVEVDDPERDAVTMEIPAAKTLSAAAPAAPADPRPTAPGAAPCDELAVTGVSARVDRLEQAEQAEQLEPPLAGEYDHTDDSDVFVSNRSASLLDETPAPDVAASTTVTLFVYGWDQVQPGPLSWVFPSLRAALDAVKTMRNAVEWCICSGESWTDVDSARDEGAVLIEQLL